MGEKLCVVQRIDGKNGQKSRKGDKVRRKIFFIGLFDDSGEAMVGSAGVAQAWRRRARDELEKAGELYSDDWTGSTEQTTGQAVAWLLQLRLASVIGSVCLGAVASLLRR
ncbi:hypothetical protein I7I51_07901 [Histoplasma capsulatum]|uniref:Uncharacterized protein n=1 Tax=Ajellomyces capsulatus TaxID=5037 RepID=A0A8A1LYZ0_AJECA|nr:hypothetical protein I7I51_07901 [Histoplasma capsulatum]